MSRLALPTAVVLALLALVIPLGAKPVPKTADKTSIKRASFHDKQFNNDDFVIWGKNTDQYVRKEKEGLRITLPAQNGPASPVGVALKYLVRGDFEFDALIETIDVPAPPGRLAAGIQVYMKIDTPPRPGLYLGTMHDRAKGPVFHTGVITDQEGGNRWGVYEEKVPTKKSASGESRLRLVRRGTKMEMF